MIISRLLNKYDYGQIQASLNSDEFHNDTMADFFYEEGTISLVYEDDNGPILVVRGKPVLHEGIGIIQLDIQYFSNKDAKRNMRAMLEGFPELERKARENGFAGFFFISNGPLLRKFCIRRLGFQEFGDEFLVKSLLDKTTSEGI